MNTRISLVVTAASILLSLSGGVFGQTPQTKPGNPIEARKAMLAARVAQLSQKAVSQKAASTAGGGVTSDGAGGGPGPTAENVLYAFDNLAPTGNSPQAGLIADSEGNFYGTASYGGNFGPCDQNGSGCGAVFKMDRAGNKSLLYNFTGGADGSQPYGSLTLDSAGNLYGTTAYGGDLSACYGNGCGVVFKLDKWGNETVLHAFTGGADGANPYGSLILDKAANLYGTAYFGGNAPGYNGDGVIFKLDNVGNETVLYTFTGGTDGGNPNAGLIFDKAGSLYSTAEFGGDLSACLGHGCGVVFKLDKAGKETVLYSFSGGTDGAYPSAGLVLDDAGNLYSTTLTGGDLSACPNGSVSTGCGVVFKLDNSGKETALYSFTGGSDGANNYYSQSAGVIRDPAGNLYGATYQGGDFSTACGGPQTGCGVVFKVCPSGGETVLHTFSGGADGSGPVGTPIFDAAGNLYGTTYGGGLPNLGTVYKLDRSGKEMVYDLASSVGGTAPSDAVVRDSAGDLYGSAGAGGTYNQGVVYKLDRWGHETPLYVFTGGADGALPHDVILDSAGNIYGVASFGGQGPGLGSGVVFKVDPCGKETVLYSFTGGTDGGTPSGGLVRDLAGNLFGVTFFGGNLSACSGQGCGVVFKVDPYGNETVLYSFTGGADGGYPLGGLIRDSADALYGTTSAGGDLSVGSGFGGGVAFKLDPSGHETVLHAFTGGIDGGYPNGSLTLDKAGNLYGAASAGGDLSACSGSGCGVVFKLDRSGNETVLYSFTGGADGISPNGAFIFDNAGSLYGTAAFGGGAGNVGTAFKLDKFGNLIVLHMFTGGADGGDPQGGLIFDPEGSLYGTAYVDGAHGAGVVFKISTY